MDLKKKIDTLIMELEYAVDHPHDVPYMIMRGANAYRDL